jgi:hypothetical protein
MTIDLTMNTDLAGIVIPDSKLAREITELVRDTESPLLFHHSSRVYYWGALAGKRRGLRFDSAFWVTICLARSSMSSCLLTT